MVSVVKVFRMCRECPGAVKNGEGNSFVRKLKKYNLGVLTFSNPFRTLTFRMHIVGVLATFMSFDWAPLLCATFWSSTFRSKANPLSNRDPLSPPSLGALWPCTPLGPFSVQNWDKTSLQEWQSLHCFPQSVYISIFLSPYPPWFRKNIIKKAKSKLTIEGVSFS